MTDPERARSIQHALTHAGLDALICSLPMHVLLLSGYWPVVGTSLVIATREGRVQVMAPSDEEELARAAGVRGVRTFKPASLHDLRSAAETVRPALQEAAQQLGLEHARIGYEDGVVTEPASYAAMFLYGAAMPRLLRATLPAASLVPASDLLARLASIKTRQELQRIQTACRLARTAFGTGRHLLRPGLQETQAAARFRAPLYSLGDQLRPGLSGLWGHAAAKDRINRSGGFAYCMSGPNAAQASGAYARSRERVLERGDLVLIHCNSQADGYWTDITRTYHLGEMDHRTSALYAAVLEARDAALDCIHPGARACEVDKAARTVLERHGLGREFKHSTGHGVGFGAIDPHARPRLHPKSPDVVEPGMVFNIEPAVYIEGFGGIRHCDMVAVTGAGIEVLTPFHTSMNELVVALQAARTRRLA
jgi:Xaa-Pro aminopeptidase